MIDLSRVVDGYRAHLERTIATCSFPLHDRLNGYVEVLDIDTEYPEWDRAGELIWPNGKMVLENDAYLFGYVDWLGNKIARPVEPIPPLYRKRNKHPRARKAWRRYERRMQRYQMEMALRESRKGELFRALFSHGTWHYADWQIVMPNNLGPAIAEIWGVSEYKDPYRHQTAALWQKAFFDHAQDAPFSDSQVARFREVMGVG